MRKEITVLQLIAALAKWGDKNGDGLVRVESFDANCEPVPTPIELQLANDRDDRGRPVCVIMPSRSLHRAAPPPPRPKCGKLKMASNGKDYACVLEAPHFGSCEFDLTRPVVTDYETPAEVETEGVL